MNILFTMCYSLCVIDLSNKQWNLIFKLLHKIAKYSDHQPNETEGDKRIGFYCRLVKSWLKNIDIEGRSTVVERSIWTLRKQNQ